MQNDSYFSLNRYYGDVREGEHLVHVPVRMGPETLAMELEACLDVVGKGNFISYKTLPAAKVLVYLMTEKLRAYASAYPEEARLAGEKMIDILEELSADDDCCFPENEIVRILDILR